jgi:hypothetical protein
MPLRIYLTSRVLVEESGTVILDERRVMGRQGRLAFAYRSGQPGRGARCLRTLQKPLVGGAGRAPIATDRASVSRNVELLTTPDTRRVPPITYPPMEWRPELSRSCLKGCLKHREHHWTRFTPTAQDFGQVRAIHPVPPGEFPLPIASLYDPFPYTRYLRRVASIFALHGRLTPECHFEAHLWCTVVQSGVKMQPAFRLYRDYYSRSGHLESARRGARSLVLQVLGHAHQLYELTTHRRCASPLRSARRRRSMVAPG